MIKITLKNLLFHISKSRKVQLLILLIITFLTSIVEMLSVASVVPFIKAATSTSENFVLEKSSILKFVSINNKKEAVFITGIIFSFFILINSLLRCLLIFITSKLSNIITAELSIKIYRASLFDSYSNHINKQTSNVISAVTQKVYQTYFTISSIITFVSSAFILIGLISVLIWINPKVMSFFIIFFSILYLAIVLLGKKTIKNNSQIINEEQNKIIFNLQNGLGSFRDIILDKTQEYFITIFAKASLNKARREAVNNIIQSSPRYILEGMGVILAAFLIIFWNYFMHSSNEIIEAFPTLAAIAIGTQKILPLINNLYLNFSIFKGNVYQVDDVLNVLNKHAEKDKIKILVKEREINFKNFISFNNVDFSYEDKNEYILENINLEIKKGSKVGIIGKSGEGKSTFLDLLMGFLEPKRGLISVDGIKLSSETLSSWQSKISHVPQKLFLSDSSILENIAFGRFIKDIDLNKVETVSKKAQLHKFINSLKEGYHEQIGERGIKLSGGQIQRVGLARSLYKNSEIIIFDEATNSLDTETERLIMEELYSLEKNLTIIIVAHRLNTLSKCDVIFEVKNKKIIKL
jgi:ABC-type multidrug transport system fused ATPase/permease subunit